MLCLIVGEAGADRESTELDIADDEDEDEDEEDEYDDDEGKAGTDDMTFNCASASSLLFLDSTRESNRRRRSK